MPKCRSCALPCIESNDSNNNGRAQNTKKTKRDICDTYVSRRKKAKMLIVTPRLFKRRKYFMQNYDKINVDLCVFHAFFCHFDWVWCQFYVFFNKMSNQKFWSLWHNIAQITCTHYQPCWHEFSGLHLHYLLIYGQKLCVWAENAGFIDRKQAQGKTVGWIRVNKRFGLVVIYWHIPR